MLKLPIVSGRELVSALSRFGYGVDHQTGSHFILRQSNSPFRRLTVPNHKVIARGTLNAIIKQAGLTREEVLGALR
jgi:predicted RNA binding protein YcfA (HicA-like mRNA interferase family)